MAVNLNRFGFFCHKCKTEKDSPVMIHCFACDANFHPQCIGLNGSMADKIKDDNGFHYYCKDHKDLSVKSLLFKLKRIQDLNSKLTNVINEYKDLFDFDPKSILNSLEEKQEMNDLTFKKAKATLSERAICASKRKNTTQNIDAMVVSKKSKDDAIEAQTEQNSNIEQPINVENIAQNSSNPSYAEVAHAFQKPEELLPISNEVTLEVAPLSKKVFLTGLSTSMSTENVKKYIEHKLNIVDINVRKMRLHDNADHSTFVITTGRDSKLFHDLLDAGFWPKNTTVKEYIENFRKNKRRPNRQKQDQIKVHQE